MNTSVMADPQVEAAKGNWQKFNAEDNEIDREIGRLQSLMADPKKRAMEDLDRAAEAMIAGEEVDLAELDRRRDEINDLRSRPRVVRRAVELAKTKYDSEVSRASREICSHLKPHQRAIVKDLARALIALGEAAVIERDLRDELMTGGVIFSSELRPMPVGGLGDPRDRYSRISMWLNEAVDFDFIAPSLIPEAWRESWGRGR